jgi:lipoprotein-anchoring transpeptidase ErfK/SrfK
MSLSVLPALCAIAALVVASRLPSAASIVPDRATRAPAAARVDTAAAPAARADSLATPAPLVAAGVGAFAPTAADLEPLARLAVAAPEPRYVVVSLRDRRLWLVEGDTVRFTAPVAVGRATPRALANPGAPRPFAATPSGRFAVERRDSMPQWVPPDWHYAEQARRRGRPLRRLARGASLVTRDGRTIRVAGAHVVAVDASGAVTRLSARSGREIVVDGAIVVPPLGTSARRYDGVLGARRLALGGELGIHGTSEPSSIGKAVTHGCIRLANEAITALYPLVPLGTPVYIR